MSELSARALDVNEGWAGLANEVFELAGATFVRNRELPARRDSNHVHSVRASTPGEIERLFEAADREYAGLPHRAFYCDYRTPPEFSARLALEGYEHKESLVMLLEGELLGEARAHEIRACVSKQDWAAYESLHEIDWLASNGGEAVTERWNPGIGFRSDRIKSPPVRSWLACVEGRPVAYFSSWEGIDGMGQVENLFTHPDFRHRGMATALMHHCVADARAHGPGPVVIVCDPNDTPKNLYASLGFRPVAIKRSWWKDVD